MKSLIDDFNRRNQPLLFYNLKQSVVNIFQAVEPVSFQHCSTERELYNTLRGKKLNDILSNYIYT